MTYSIHDDDRPNEFQSTHPRRVWPANRHTCVIVYKFQSTHPRRVWRKNPALGSFKVNVSIHTPTKGVTISCRLLVRLTACFNPHTHEGCDFGFCYHKHGTFGFQSTHPRRVWRKLESQNVVNNSVSIHTPTKGVTHLFCLHVRVSDVSIHTPTKGVTNEALWQDLPRGSFNPHTHEGCDDHYYSEFPYTSVSIHTPTKGVTFNARSCRSYQCVSIHTPTKGVTSFWFWRCSRWLVSIHTPTKGVTFLLSCSR